jgi:hypothetical protein
MLVVIIVAAAATAAEAALMLVINNFLLAVGGSCGSTSLMGVMLPVYTVVMNSKSTEFRSTFKRFKTRRVSEDEKHN